MKIDIKDYAKDLYWGIKEGGGLRVGLKYARIHLKAKNSVRRYWRILSKTLYESVSCVEDYDAYNDYICEYWDSQCNSILDDIKMMKRYSPEELVEAALCRKLDVVK